MIQLNLLPDVKIAYLKAKRSKRLVLIISTILASVSLASMIGLFVVVDVLQKSHLKDLDRDINKLSSQLQNTPDLNKILTIQNQLASLPALHDKKPAVTRLFNYIGQITPAQVNYSRFGVDLGANSVNTSGSTDSLATVNTFVDTLKFTTFKATPQDADKPAFSSVVLSSFARSDKGITFSITFSFDPAIFDSSNTATLNVPHKITTRSEIEKPSALFQSNNDNKKP